MDDIRITKSTKKDEERTTLLGISELVVIRCPQTKDDYFVVTDSDDGAIECPECRKRGEKFEYYSKCYMDCIKEADGSYRYITLDHRFRKCICRNHTDRFGRNRIKKLSREYDFAYPNANVTKRMENRLVYLAMVHSCYGAESVLDRLFTRQAIGSMAKRWVARCDELRGIFNTPRYMAVISGTDGDRGYVFYADASLSKLRILDVRAGIDSKDISDELKKFEISKVSLIVTDSNPIIVDALRGCISSKTDLAVDVDSLIPPLNEAMMRYMKQNARQISKIVKGRIITARDNLSDADKDTVDEALENRDELRNIYLHVNKLRRIIKREGMLESYEDFTKWCREVPEDSTRILSDTTVYIEEYTKEIINFYRRRNALTGDIFIKIKALVDKLATVRQWSERAPELMRGRILYSGMIEEYEDLESRQWNGISYDEVLKNIDNLIKEGKTKNIDNLIDEDEGGTF